MQKWEYLELGNPDIKEMNAWGEDGWELIAVIVTHESGATPYIYYFKRPKLEIATD